ncbi:MAG TPA: L-threonylcarbamoyladenylate synthase [Candidatus Limnocylindria bacterium]|nr:L-threonylcarbamoyladenylate synthase [Candidatus Limnocylindria bacterium]
MTELLGTGADDIERAVALLRNGELVAFPTDTVYGVGIAASRRDRLEAIFELKNRPLDKRIPILVADLAQVIDHRVDERAQALAERFWPGALTLVLAGADATQAYRAPDHPVALALIRAAGPLLTTSANRSNEPDTLGADEVLIAFARQQDELAAVVDGGSVPGGRASTVVDLSVVPARILRDGPIARQELATVVELAP